MTTKMYTNDRPSEDETAMKRRKKSAIDEYRQESESPKQILLPQKKRVLSNTDNTSPAKKTVKSSQAEEPVDDETLIRETEAALKSLSGSWPGPRGNRGTEHEESPTFENLFEEKKGNPKLSPSSSTTSSGSNDNSCSLKDVITLRDQHSEEKSSKLDKNFPKTKIKTEKDDSIEYEMMKVDDQNDLKRKDKNGGSHYEPPDFNELVDDSSNELEIDMSDQSENKESDTDEKPKGKKREEDIKRERYQERSISQSTPYAPYSQSSTPTFSATSAFKPPNDSKRPIGIPSTVPPIGPYPAEATFVGYPSNVVVPQEPLPTPHEPQPEEKLRPSSNLMQLKSLNKDGQETRTNGLPVKPSPVSIGSPEANSKQYTILQPAPAGSRAASALQDIAREGLPIVSAVSNSGTSTSSDSSSKMITGSNFDRPTRTLSPNSMNRGRCSFNEFA